MKLSRVWAMPNHDTFTVPPIGEFVKLYLTNSKISVDPFARNKNWFTHTNDLNPETSAKHHMEAVDFGKFLQTQKVTADLVIFDPPYSPRQISECYKSFGKTCGMKDTQSSFWTKMRDAFDPIIPSGGVVLSFGWNTVGMGKKRGYEQIEILLVCHGGAHNDTICLAERKL